MAAASVNLHVIFDFFKGFLSLDILFYFFVSPFLLNKLTS